jgi:hypothetical protein
VGGVGVDRQIQGGFGWVGDGSDTRCKVPSL